MRKKNKTRKLSIRWKILIPVTLVFIMGCVTVGYYAVNSYNEELRNTALNQAESACNIAVNTINPQEIVSLTPGDEESEVYQNNLNALLKIADDCGIKYLYTIYEKNGKLYYGLDIDTSEERYNIGDAYEGDTYSELEPVLRGEMVKSEEIDNTENGDHLLTVYKPIYDENGNIVAIMGCDYDASHVIDSRNSIIKSLVLVLIATLVFDVILINFIVGKTMKDINSVEEKLYNLVHKDGDLTQKLLITTGDECENIAENINNLLEYIRDVVVNIANNSLTLGLSSEEVVKNVDIAENKVTEITSVLEEMSAAMEETSASLNQVSDSVSQITTAIDSISQNANDGSLSSTNVMNEATNIYQSAIKSRENVLVKAKEMAVSLEEKIEKSKAVEQINSLTEEIISITEQTTLLSLNASIEAARAGESGRGFAVVADEIGKLANSSSAAAVEIRKVNDEVLLAVTSLAKEAESMIHFMESVTVDGYDNLLDTSKNYEENIGLLNDMLISFSEQCDMLKINITSINETTNAVNIAIEESAQGISHIAESAVELTHGVSYISEQANETKNISLNLRDEVNKFKYE